MTTLELLFNAVGSTIASESYASMGTLEGSGDALDEVTFSSSEVGMPLVGEGLLNSPHPSDVLLGLQQQRRQLLHDYRSLRCRMESVQCVLP